MGEHLDVDQIESALGRAAHRAIYGTLEERSGRFLPSKEFAVDRLRSVVRKPGFIHTLSHMILKEMIFGSEAAIRNRNRFELISFHEVALILSLLSELPIDHTVPSGADIANQYSKCKRTLDELHKILNAYPKVSSISEYFSKGEHFIESFFYAAGAAFWFDYLNLAPELYDLDRDFLKREGYLIPQYAELLRRAHDIFYTKLRDFSRTQRKNLKRGMTIQSPLECFIYSPSDFRGEQAVIFEEFARRFAVRCGEVPLVVDPISFHPAKARPAVQFPDGRLFIPVLPMVCEQLFENPFYVIAGDARYFAANANNRGEASERIVVDLLKGVRHFNIFADVKLSRQGKVIAQIDAIALFGASAILFETKTKRLTEASKLGNTDKLLQDVQFGILDAQQQLANSKALLLSKGYDSASSRCGDVNMLDGVTQVLCVSIMTHEIPAYPLLIKTILESKSVSGIIPINIFDLKVISFYLDNAFDFLYYFAIRTVLDRQLMYGTEQALLATHLKVRLTIPSDASSVYIDDSFGQSIDADYPAAMHGGQKLTLRFGISLVDDIIEQLIAGGDPSSFRLFSVLRGMSGGAARQLKKILMQMEGMLLKDGRAHDGSILFDGIIVTFVIANFTKDAEALVDLLMQKRDAERKYDQEYFIWLLPANAPEIKRADVSKRKLSNMRPHVLAGFAMKRRNSKDQGLTAFSPHLPKDAWNVKQNKSRKKG